MTVKPRPDFRRLQNRLVSLQAVLAATKYKRGENRYNGLGGECVRGVRRVRLFFISSVGWPNRSRPQNTQF